MPLDTTLFGTPRVALWPLFDSDTKTTINGVRPARTVADELIRFCSTVGDPDNLYMFRRREAKSTTEDFSGTGDGPRRNRELYEYLQRLMSEEIPGFGGSFNGKYGVAARDQLITQFFDFIRTTNLNDPALINLPGIAFNQQAGTYTDTVERFNPDENDQGVWFGHGLSDNLSPGQVLPISISAPGTRTPTRGAGRFPVIDSAALVFFVDEPWERPDPNFRPNNRQDITDDVPADPGTNLAKVRVALVLSWLHPMDGYSLVFNRFRVSAEQTAGTASAVVKSGTGQIVGNSSFNFFGGDSATVMADAPSSMGENGRNFGSLHGIAPTLAENNIGEEFDESTIPDESYELYGHNTVTLQGDPATLRWGFTGATFEITIFSANGADEVQRVTLDFPATHTEMPVPGPHGYDRWPGPNYFQSDFGNKATAWSVVPFNNGLETVPVYGFPPIIMGIGEHRWEPGEVSGQPFANRDGRTRHVVGRKTIYGWPGPDTHPFGGGIYYGDVVQGIESVHGDARILAYLREVDESQYIPSPGYLEIDPNASGRARANAHSLRAEGGVKLPNGGENANPRTGLSGRGTWHEMLPAVESNLIPSSVKGFTDLVIQNLPGEDDPEADVPGDFTTTFGGNVDGPFLGHPDEGSTNDISDRIGGRPPYYGYSHQVNSANITSPNMQIRSAIQFGAMPTGIKDQPPTPWQTLLFRPEVSFHPGAADPKDHLLADFFHMPVVEPYAMSEPLSTAGKINLNYQIIPFSHIRRETGIRAVLKNERVTALSSTTPYYKNGWDGHARQETIRFPINIEETLEGFEDKFDDDEIFRSATEICDIHLVPEKDNATYAEMDAFWNNHRMTGDNLKERPYSTIHPRVTTQSNTYTVYVRAQALKKVPGTPAGEWVEGEDQVVSEQRSSTTIERYVDPNDPDLPDFATDPEQALGPFYRFRVLNNKRFAP